MAGNVAGWRWLRFRGSGGQGGGFPSFGFNLFGGFVWELVAEGAEALEFLDRPAVVALGLDLIAEEKGKRVGMAVHAVEAFGEEVVAILGLGDFVVFVDEI